MRKHGVSVFGQARVSARGYITLAVLGVPKMESHKKCYITPTVLGSQSREESKRRHDPCRLRVPKVGRNQMGSITPAI